MVSKEILREISETLRRNLVMRLIDLLLESREGAKLPSEKARMLLYLWSQGRLESVEGLMLLLEAATIDPEGLGGILDEYGLETLKREVLR